MVCSRPKVFANRGRKSLRIAAGSLCEWPDLQPIASRLRQRLVMTQADAGDLAALLDHLVEQAGNPGLMSAELKDTLVTHAGGNPRALTVMGDMLLAAGAEKNREVLDEKLFMEILGEPAKPKRARR